LKLSREVKTGILAIGAIILIIFGFNYLKGKNLLSNDRIFYVNYNNVEGLSPSAPVTINGLNVGKVMGISLTETSGDLLVKFTIKDDFEFSKNSVVKIYSSGFIGGKSLALIPSQEGEKAKSGDFLNGKIDVGIIDTLTERLIPLEEKLNSTLSGLDTLIFGFNNVMNEDTQSNIQQIIANLNKTVASFKGASEKVNNLLAVNSEKLDRTFTNLDTTSENFAKFSDSLAKLEINKIVQNFEMSLSKFNNIMQSIENGEGSIGKLLKDEELYNNLEGASKQLEQLLEDMKLNPKRYVHFSLFGKKGKEYDVPEKED